MRFIIEIDMEGDAFQDRTGTEVARILRQCAAWLNETTLLPATEKQAVSYPIVRDTNGNRCGSVTVEE